MGSSPEKDRNKPEKRPKETNPETIRKIGELAIKGPPPDKGKK